MMNSYIDVFMPGRLCILGEHSDWASAYQTENPSICNGAALILGLDKGIYIRARKSNKLIYRCNLEKINTSIECGMEIKELNKEINKSNLNLYVLSTIKTLKEKFCIIGMELECYKVNLPIKKGLASSAAICMAVIRAGNILYSLNLSLEEEMELAYIAERNVGSKCGKMDQVCAYGNKLLSMKFLSNKLEVQEINADKKLNILIVDLDGEKNTRKILKDLNSRYPFPKSDEDELLYEALGSTNELYVQNAIDFIEEGSIDKVGTLMNEAQQIFDEHVAIISPIELEAKRLHEILNDTYIKGFVYGGKGVGSQGDGSAQLLLKSEEAGIVLEQYIKQKYGYNTYLVSTKSMEKIRKAVIPLAGYATRLYPASKVIEKSLLPVYDSDGLLKPSLIIQIEELIGSGIEKLCLVIREDQTSIKELFESKYIYEEEMDYFEHLKQLGTQVEFVIQKENKGFGAAVLESESFANGESVLVALGDYLLKSKENMFCTRQFMKYWETYNGIMVSIKPVSINEVSNYGILAGKWIDKEKKVMKVTSFVEKPTKEYAIKNLAMEDSQHQTVFYCVFAQYIIDKSIYNILYKNVQSQNTKNEEVDLTKSLNEIARMGLLRAVVINGNSFDIGLPEQYYYTMCNFNL